MFERGLGCYYRRIRLRYSNECNIHPEILFLEFIWRVFFIPRQNVEVQMRFVQYNS